MRLLICQFDLNVIDDGEGIDLAVELAGIARKEVEHDVLWVAVAALRLSDGDVEMLCKTLDISVGKISRSHRSTGFSEGTVLLGNVLSYLYSYDSVVIYDCNQDDIVADVVMESENSRSAIYRVLQGLDDAHNQKHVGRCLELVDEATNVLRSMTGDVSRAFRSSIAPIGRFFRTYLNMVQTLELRVERWSRGGSGLVAVDFGPRLQRLRSIVESMEDELSELDIFAKSLAFFQYGSRCLAAVRERGSRSPHDAIHRVLLWYCVHLLAASAEEGMGRRGNGALLLAFRSLEVYVVAYLLDVGRIEIRRDFRFVLDGRDSPRFVDLWTRFVRYAPAEFIEPLDLRVKRLRWRRNENVLTHGFEHANGVAVREARSCVKGVMRHWDRVYFNGSGLAEGPLGEFARGERWSGDLGRWVAKVVERSVSTKA